MEKQKVIQRDKLWASQIRNGNQEAFTNLYNTYYSELCFHAQRKVGDVNRSKDFVHDIFTWVWNSRDHWEPNNSVKAYLYRALDNRIITCFRKKHFNLLLENDQNNFLELLNTPEVSNRDGQEMQLLIRKLIDQLPNRCRSVAQLYVDYGMTYKEIASTLDITVYTVDMQLRRARKGISREFKKHYNIADLSKSVQES